MPRQVLDLVASCARRHRPPGAAARTRRPLPARRRRCAPNSTRSPPRPAYPAITRPRAVTGLAERQAALVAALVAGGAAARRASTRGGCAATRPRCCANGPGRSRAPGPCWPPSSGQQWRRRSPAWAAGRAAAGLTARRLGLRPLAAGAVRPRPPTSWPSARRPGDTTGVVPTGAPPLPALRRLLHADRDVGRPPLRTPAAGRAVGRADQRSRPVGSARSVGRLATNGRGESATANWVRYSSA